MPRFYLVDAHAFLHRAYHALPPLTNSKGEPVGALYGFARMLLKLVKKEKPDHAAVCFDTPGPTFRHKAYEAYKATRRETDEDLKVQLAQAEELARAMGFACVSAPGYEADDLMATLARQGVGAGWDAVLVTSDKDALQLVGPGIRVFNISKETWMDPPQIQKKFGVGPESLVDFLAITGDSSDNVPGVKGVGAVGAAKILNKYHSIAAALKAAKAHDPGIPEKLAQALLRGEPQLKESRALIQLEDQAPLKLKLSDCRAPKPAADALQRVMERLEFTSLLKEMLPGPASGEIKLNGHAKAENSSAAIRETTFKLLHAELSKTPALIVACQPQGQAELLDQAPACLALGLQDGRLALDFEKKELKNAESLLAGTAMKVGHDLKQTQAALDLLEFSLKPPFFDTMLAQYLLNPTAARPKPKDMEVRQALKYQAGQALEFKALNDRLSESGVLKLYEEVELPLWEILRAMEKTGIMVDAGYLRGLAREFEAQIAELKTELDGMAEYPINVNSSKQLGELLYDKLQLPVTHKTPKGGRSTDEEALAALADLSPIPAKVLEYRELTKLKSTYIEGLLERLDPETGRVHTHFDQTGTATGRISSNDPNLQNIPIRTPMGQKIRRAFAAPEGRLLLSADYSQIDLRVLAHVSGDPVLRRAFARDEDIHTRTACEMFGVAADAVTPEMRRKAKAVNFGIVYGQTAHGLSQQLKIPYGQAAEYIRRYFQRYQGVADWLKRNLEAAKREGLVRTISGRLRYLPELKAKNTALRQFGERAAGNTPIQGGSADIIKYAMLRVHKALADAHKLKARLMLQIHDELLFEVPSREIKPLAELAREAMEGALKLDVPLRVDVKVGANWQDMAPL